MPTTKKLIDEALSLPVEDRVLLADSLLQSLNMPNKTIDKKWGAAAKKRLKELLAGKVKPIPGGEVFDRIHERFSK